MLLLALATGLLLYRAFTSRDPQMVLVVKGDESWAEFSLSLQGRNLAAPLSGTLNVRNKYTIPFFLEPGTYTLRIVDGQRQVLERSYTLDASNPEQLLNLVVERPATAPASQPGG